MRCFASILLANIEFDDTKYGNIVDRSITLQAINTFVGNTYVRRPL